MNDIVQVVRKYVLEVGPEWTDLSLLGESFFVILNLFSIV